MTILKIALDAGHGLYTSGKRNMKALDPNETHEWFMNDKIMDKVQKKLLDYECEVLRLDDTTGKNDISLSARCVACNNWGATVMLSMHHNAGLNGRAGGGTVVFHSNPCTERTQQAKTLYDCIVGETGLVGNRSEKVICKGFYVIKNVKCASFLVENGFMDSPTDVPIIVTDEHAEKTANGVIKFLVKEFALKKKYAKPEIVTGVSAGALKTNKTDLPSLKGYSGFSIVDGLKSFGYDSSFSYRKSLWSKLGKTTKYKGTSEQNLEMVRCLKEI